MPDSTKSRLPNSAEDYVNGVVGALPQGMVGEGFKRLQLFSPAQALPHEQESLFEWLRTAKDAQEGNLRLTLILGETDSDYRDRRSNAANSGKMTMARTCDGVFGALAVVGLLRACSLSLDSVDFGGTIDEWSSVDERLAESHLLVIGSPEVNICAAFLHGLVHDFHFGDRSWPPNVFSTGGVFRLGGRSYARNPEDVKQFHDGGVFLLKNPWNPQYRLLWIAGVSGRGTGFGASLVSGNWRGREDDARKSIGVVFRRKLHQETLFNEQFIWLQRLPEGAAWNGTLNEHASLGSHVFLSHDIHALLAALSILCQGSLAVLHPESLPGWGPLSEEVKGQLTRLSTRKRVSTLGWNEIVFEELHRLKISTEEQLQHALEGIRATLISKIQHRALDIVRDFIGELIIAHRVGRVDSPSPSSLSCTAFCLELLLADKESEAPKVIATRLEKIRPGNEHASKFEYLIHDILNLLFRPSLATPKVQLTTADGLCRKDIVFSNSASDGFWGLIRQKHGNATVCFEVKNKTSIDNDDVNQICSRLSPQTGQVGFIVCQSYGNRDLERAAHLLPKGEIVILISTKDLIEACQHVEWRNDSTKLLMEKYRTLIEGIL